MQIFGKEANQILPMNMQEVKANLHKNHVVICGALRYADNSTTDSTAAHLANFLRTPLINITNVNGLYSANPLTHKNTKFIPSSSWKNFEKRAHRIKYHAGQHFVLDQQASTLIRKHRTKTYIIGKNLNNLNNILNHKPFLGTVIEG